MRIAFGTIATALLATAVGCAHGEATKEVEAQPAREYRIAREDVIEVSIWKEPELSRTLPVRPDGKITLPLVGDVEAEGKTPAELEIAVQKKLTPLVRDPRVTVLVHDINGSRVFVTGMVTHPGAFPLRRSMDVLEPLAMAGRVGGCVI